jgi:hypothetical protein
METKQRQRSPKAYTYVDGQRVRFHYKKTTDRLSAYGLWLREHPDGIGGILDMRAVMK